MQEEVWTDNEVELHQVNKTQKNAIWRLLSYVAGERMCIYEDTSKKSNSRYFGYVCHLSTHKNDIEHKAQARKLGFLYT